MKLIFRSRGLPSRSIELEGYRSMIIYKNAVFKELSYGFLSCAYNLACFISKSLISIECIIYS